MIGRPGASYASKRGICFAVDLAKEISMKIFLSWSGERSRAVAEALRDWIPNVLQGTKPFCSSNDIDSGSQWFAAIMDVIAETQFGILCITKENKERPWILFEAGAISKAIGSNRVVPLLVDLQVSEIGPPISFFNAVKNSKKDVRKLVFDINKLRGDLALAEKSLEATFEKWWPDLEQMLGSVKDINEELRSPVEPDRAFARSILEEVLESNRSIVRMLTDRNQFLSTGSGGYVTSLGFPGAKAKFVGLLGDLHSDYELVRLTFYGNDENAREVANLNNPGVLSALNQIGFRPIRSSFRKNTFVLDGEMLLMGSSKNEAEAAVFAAVTEKMPEDVGLGFLWADRESGHF